MNTYTRIYRKAASKLAVIVELYSKYIYITDNKTNNFTLDGLWNSSNLSPRLDTWIHGKINIQTQIRKMSQ
jgi:hypothetical protein